MSSTVVARPDMQTECFIYELVPGLGPLYDQLHSNVWPEVLEYLHAVGISDYSIYRRGDLVISVWTRAVAAPQPELRIEIGQKVKEWNDLMEPLFATHQDEQGKPLLAERIFRL